VFRFQEGKILRRPLLVRQLRNDVVGLLRMTSARVFVILREPKRPKNLRVQENKVNGFGKLILSDLYKVHTGLCEPLRKSSANLCEK
jgi:hypothetical protein